MKLTLGWLKEHLATAADLAAITDKLTALGLEVEGVDDPAARLAPFTVAAVLTAAPHPNADKLRLCTVDAGDGTPYQVVCGAPNARAGIKGVFARIGTTIPASGLVLKPTSIRGVESQGMLCSMREMGLGEDHDGIIELPAAAPVGAPFAAVLGLDDAVIDIAVTPNRQDCLGIRGIARDLAAGGLGTLKPAPVAPLAGQFASPIGVTLEAPEACPLFLGRLVRGVVNRDSPAWLKRRLEAIGLRPISALVDITNFLTFDRARPLHVFDAAKLTGGIVVRRGRAGETFDGLDGRHHAVDETMVVIADGAGVLGLGGIVGGVASSCTAATTDVFIEAAWFDPLTIARTGRLLGIESDARHRFERGVDPASAAEGMELATGLIVALCGGSPGAVVTAGAPPPPAPAIAFRPAQVARLTGLVVAEPRMAEILGDLGFTVVPGSPWSVTAPSWRRDIEGEADLVEEIARVTGLDQLPVEPLPDLPVVPRPGLSPEQRRVRQARRLLAARGLVETVNYSFIPEAQAAAFGGTDPALKLANPISVELAVMRPSLVPSLAAAAARNAARGTRDIALFEVAAVYRGVGPGDQTSVAAGLRAGATTPRHWQKTRRPVDPFDVKADLFAVLAEANVPLDSATVSPDGLPPWLHPGQGGMVRLGPKTVLGCFGTLHPRVARLFDLDGPVAVFEAYLGALPAPKPRATRERPPLALSDLPAVERDFAFLMAEDVAADKLVRAIRAVDKSLIAAVTVFDRYQGTGVAEGEVSLALAVRLAPAERTLTEAEIEAISARIVAAAAKATGARLRT